MRSDHRFPLRGVLLASAIALAASSISAQAQAYNYRLVHRFSTQSDGSNATGGVGFDAAGNLYGATRNGGDADAGTIYKIAIDGTESVVHSFDGEAGGDQPLGGVLINQATGDIYGTTGFGGDMSTCGGVGCGALYKLAADGTYTVLHYFDGDNDGSAPAGRLIGNSQGNLYGVTSNRGAYNHGTIFRYGADGSFTVLHDFEGSPSFSMNKAGVIGDKAGNLYGVSNGSVPEDLGTIYRLAPDGTYTTLYSFTGGDDGEYPRSGLTRDEAGNLYGSTTSTVFKLAPDGSLTTLYTFTGDADGADPNGDLLLIGGDLYGTANSGGNPACTSMRGCGVVFKVATDGSTFAVLQFFAPHDPGPSSGLTAAYGRLFGTTESGGYRGPGLRPGSVYSIGVDRP